MQRNPAVKFTAPHQHDSSLVLRYFEWFMHSTYENPALTQKMLLLGGLLSTSLATASITLAAKGKMGTGAAIASTALGLAGVGVSGIHWFVQNKIYGKPKEEKEVYENSEVRHEDAVAVLTVSNGNLPKLSITAKNAFNAGFVESLALGSAMHATLERIDFLYSLARPLLGLPKEKEMGPYLAGITKKVYESQDTIDGRIAGYNAWLLRRGLKSKPLTLERFLLIHSISDLPNYDLFGLSAPFKPSMGCTTIAFKLKNYDFITRIMDWPAYGVAGNYFIQLHRNIENRKQTLDLGFPLLSGALTVVNEDGLFLEMNVSREAEILKRPRGKPAPFYNRELAEQAANLTELKAIIEEKEGPLSAYHLLASTGDETGAIHFYQNTATPNQHNFETLDKTLDLPLLIVTNHGVQDVKGNREVLNYKDSTERKNNINAFFKQATVEKSLLNYIEKQDKGQALSPEDILDIKRICLECARLPLVKNCESVLCAIYVFSNIDGVRKVQACAATDNGYAPRHPLSQFKNLDLAFANKESKSILGGEHHSPRLSL